MIDRLIALGQKRSTRVGFYLTLVTVLVLALLPQDASGGIPHVDKLMHFLLFGALATGARLTHQHISFAALAAALLAYGGLMELLQGMTAWRMASAGDLLADGLGILAGLYLSRMLWSVYEDV